jgi:hypothetical protein
MHMHMHAHIMPIYIRTNIEHNVMTDGNNVQKILPTFVIVKPALKCAIADYFCQDIHTCMICSQTTQRAYQRSYILILHNAPHKQKVIKCKDKYFSQSQSQHQRRKMSLLQDTRHHKQRQTDSPTVECRCSSALRHRRDTRVLGR